MPIPGFPPAALDSEGLPAWIADLASFDPNHILHVVRGMEPAQALRTLGADAESIRSCVLPDSNPSERESLPFAVLGDEAWGTAALLAGRVGEWTFVYDDCGYTYDGTAEALSRDGRTAVTTVYTVNGDACLIYAVNGAAVASIYPDDLSLETDLPGMPAELRAAIEAAGVADWEDLEPGEVDSLIGMRAACALAGLTVTLDDIRRIPLLIAPLHEPD